MLEPIAAPGVDRRAVLWLGTRNSGLELACGMDHDIEATSPVEIETTAIGDGAQVVVQAELGAGEALRLRKYVAYHWAAQAAAGALAARAGRTLDRARRRGYEHVEPTGLASVVAWRSRAIAAPAARSGRRWRPAGSAGERRLRMP